MNNNSNSNFRYAHSDIILKILMHCGKTKKAVELKTKSGFSFINLIMSIEESMATIIMKSFPGGKMIAQ